MNSAAEFESEQILGRLETMSFGKMVEWHIDEGTRPPGDPAQGKAWRKADLAEAVSISERGLRFWLADEKQPPEIETLERVLLGSDATFAMPLRAALHRALRRTKALAKVRRSAKAPRKASVSEANAGSVPSVDEIAVIAEFRSADDIGQFLADLPYSFEITERVEEVLRLSRNQSTLFGHLEDLCRSSGGSAAEIQVSTIIANVISKIDYWRPDPAMIVELQIRCKSLVREEDDSRIMFVEALAFGLSKVGASEALEHSISKFHRDMEWGDADFNRIEKYYGNFDNIYRAMVRHHRDVKRTGLLAANNTHRLLRLAPMLSPKLNYERELQPMLLRAVSALYQAKMEGVAGEVVDLSIRTRRSIKA